MITKELIARINELSRKKRSSGLSEDERIEQQNLREQYLAGIREQVRNMLDFMSMISTWSAYSLFADVHELLLLNTLIAGLHSCR